VASLSRGGESGYTLATWLQLQKSRERLAIDAHLVDQVRQASCRMPSPESSGVFPD